ncbi:hypothetical protein SDC9_80132 [bioreactor metagenome]|uniref:Uncharacterized protein n=1 Tax=bioreactor metagenome TaxID=1076179 RepID=A0A644YYD6_9ZZZZ
MQSLAKNLKFAPRNRSKIFNYVRKNQEKEVHHLQTMEKDTLGSICLPGQNNQDRGPVCNLLLACFQQRYCAGSKQTKECERDNYCIRRTGNQHRATVAVPTSCKSCSGNPTERDRTGCRPEHPGSVALHPGSRPSQPG